MEVRKMMEELWPRVVYGAMLYALPRYSYSTTMAAGAVAHNLEAMKREGLDEYALQSLREFHDLLSRKVIDIKHTDWSIVWGGLKAWMEDGGEKPKFLFTPGTDVCHPSKDDIGILMFALRWLGGAGAGLPQRCGAVEGSIIAAVQAFLAWWSKDEKLVVLENVFAEALDEAVANGRLGPKPGAVDRTHEMEYVLPKGSYFIGDPSDIFFDTADSDELYNDWYFSSVARKCDDAAMDGIDSGPAVGNPFQVVELWEANGDNVVLSPKFNKKAVKGTDGVTYSSATGLFGVFTDDYGVVEAGTNGRFINASSPVSVSFATDGYMVVKYTDKDTGEYTRIGIKIRIDD